MSEFTHTLHNNQFYLIAIKCSEENNTILRSIWASLYKKTHVGVKIIKLGKSNRQLNLVVHFRDIMRFGVSESRVKVNKIEIRFK